MESQNGNQNQTTGQKVYSNVVPEELKSYLNSNLNLHIVFIANLPEKIPHQELFDMCSQYGDVYDLVYPLAKSRKAFCIYFDSRSASKLIKSMNGKLYKNEKIKLKIGCSCPNYLLRRRGVCSKVYVYSSYSKSEVKLDEIKTVMAKYGEIKDAYEIAQGKWIVNYYDIRSSIQCVNNIKKCLYKKENMSFRFFKTLNDLYDEIRKTQIQLCCERGMRLVEYYSKDQIREEAFKSQIELLMNAKYYYLKFLSLTNPPPKILAKIPTKAIRLSKTNEEHIIMPEYATLSSIFELLLSNPQKAKYLLDENVCNLLSFSIIPALTNYFTIDILHKNPKNEDFEHHDYTILLKNLVTKYKENTNNETNHNLIFKAIVIFITPMFASPYFVKYISEVFQPVFAKLQDKLINIDKKKIEKEIDNSIEELNERIQKNSHLIPSYISISMNLIPDKPFFIKNCFLDLAFKSATTSIAYGIFHFSKPPTPSLLDTIRKKLDKDSFYDCFITSLYQSYGNRLIIKENGNLSDQRETTLYKKESLNYFREDMIQYQFKKIFQTAILSQTDMSLIAFINASDGSKSFQLPSQPSKDVKDTFHKVFLSFATPEDNKFVDEVLCGKSNFNSSSGNQTMTDMKDFLTPSLRHLLQASDILPELLDDSYLDGLDVVQMFKKLLKFRGDIGAMSLRMRYYHNIKSLLIRKDYYSQIHFVSNQLPFTLLEQLDEVETLTISSSIYKCVSIIKYIFEDRFLKISTLSEVAMLDSNSKLIKKSHNINEYFKNNEFLRNDLFENMFRVYKKTNSDNSDENNAILFKLIQKKDRPIRLDFMDYLYKNNPEDKKYDDEYNYNMNNHYDEIISLIIEQQFTKNPKKSSRNSCIRLSATPSSEIITQINNNNQPQKNNNNNNDDNDVDKAKKDDESDDSIDIDANIVDDYDENQNKNNEKFDENKFFKEKIELFYRERQELFQTDQSDFCETSIFKLVENVTNLFNESIFYIENGLTYGTSLGADQKAEIYPIIILLFKPPNIQALCKFLSIFTPICDFCFNRGFQDVGSHIQIAKSFYESAVEILKEREGNANN